MNQEISDEGVCRTAPATPGLLKKVSTDVIIDQQPNLPDIQSRSVLNTKGQVRSESGISECILCFKWVSEAVKETQKDILFF